MRQAGRRALQRAGAIPLLLLSAALAGGCASLPYHAGSAIDYRPGPPLKPGEPQIVRGRPIPVLDSAGWIWPGSLLGKLLLWNHKVDSHRISPETESLLTEYLRTNKLDNVKVRLNGYCVGDEWRRSMRNRSIGAGWRYTFGIFNCIAYTFMPGRFFGGDNYRPYSNTINIYSDIPAVLLHEGGHAKDFAHREYKGTYAFAYIIPFFNLYAEALATSDALSYLRGEQQLELQQQGYNTLYPAYCTYIGGDVGGLLMYPWGELVSVFTVIPGHVAGRMKSHSLAEASN